jgi:hypothetical protein
MPILMRYQFLIFITQKEYLCAFVKEHFKDGLERKKWITEQEKLLLDSETQQVIDTIKR